MPGSTFTMDEQSVLNLGYYKNAATNNIKEFAAFKVSLKTLPGESKALSGGLFALMNPPTEKRGTNAQAIQGSFYGILSTDYATYWQYFQSASVNIFGKINFESGNTAPYELAGNINIHQVSVNSANIQSFSATALQSLNQQQVKIQTYSLELETYASVWFDGGTDLLVANNNKAIMNTNYYYISPLISQGIAYYKEKDSADVTTGTFDSYTGLFKKSNGNLAFFYTDNSILVDNSNTESALNLTTSLQSCVADNTIHGISSNGVQYIRYAGLWCNVVSIETDANNQITKIYANTARLTTKTELKSGDTVLYSYAQTPFTWITAQSVWKVTY